MRSTLSSRMAVVSESKVASISASIWGSDLWAAGIAFLCVQDARRMKIASGVRSEDMEFKTHDSGAMRLTIRWTCPTTLAYAGRPHNPPQYNPERHDPVSRSSCEAKEICPAAPAR